MIVNVTERGTLEDCLRLWPESGLWGSSFDIKRYRISRKEPDFDMIWGPFRGIDAATIGVEGFTVGGGSGLSCWAAAGIVVQLVMPWVVYSSSRKGCLTVPSHWLLFIVPSCAVSSFGMVQFAELSLLVGQEHWRGKFLTCGESLCCQFVDWRLRWYQFPLISS